MEISLSSIIIIFCLPVIVNIIFRLIVAVITWQLMRRFAIKLKVSTIGIASLKGILINLANGLNIEIGNVYFSSKFIDPNFKSLIVICLSDLRVQGDFVDAIQRSTQSQEKSHQSQCLPDSDQTSLSNANANNRSSNNSNQSRNLSAIKSLLWLRFLSVKIENTSFMQLGVMSNNVKQECLLHTTLQDVQLNLSSSSTKSLAVECKAQGLTVKVLKHVKHNVEETCLAHISLDIYCCAFYDENFDIDIQFKVTQSQVMLYEALPLHILQANTVNTPEVDLNKSEKFFLPQLISNLHTSPLKRVGVTIEGSSLKLMRERGQKALVIEFESIESDLAKSSDNEIEARLIVSTMTIATSQATLISLNRTSAIVKAEQQTAVQKCHNLILVSEIVSCHILYNEEEIKYWVNLLRSTANKDIEKLRNVQKSPSFIKKILRQSAPYVKINLSSEITDVSLSVKPIISSSAVSSSSSFGLKSGKINCAVNPDPLFQEISGELLLDTLWCWNGDGALRPANPNSLKKYHQKNVPLYLTTLFAKGRYTNLSDFQINCVSDGLQANMDYFLKVVDLLDAYRKDLDSDRPESSSRESYLEKRTYSSPIVQVNLTSVNIFCADIMLRVDAVNVDSNNSKMTTTINGVSINSLYAPSAALVILKASELIRYRIGYFSQFKMICNHDVKEATINVTEELFVQWSPAFHLTMIELAEKIASKMVFKPKPVDEFAKHSSTFFTTKISGKIRVGALLSTAGENMFLETNMISIIVHSSNRIACKSDAISISFDEHSMLECENINVLLIPESESNSFICRKDYVSPPLEMTRNRTLSVAIENVRVLFPYEYNFAEVFNERIVTITKWLKQLHLKKGTGEGKVSVPFDILLKLDTAIMEIADDPFEVKLRDNYELLEDEYNESVKRTQMLNEKLRKTNLLLPISKIEELHSALAKKNADIYIQRSKKLHPSTQRTQLFTLQVDGVNMQIVADSSYSGCDKIVKIMRHIDRESPFPEDITFNTLWCRRIKGSIQNGTVLLRDFTQPMMEVKDLNCYGIIIGAEQEASQRAKRNCFIDVGPNVDPIVIERSMVQLKFYHDLNFNVELITFTRGTCWDPVLQQVGIAFEAISRPSLDPSPSLSWWDKMRFLFHGPISIASQHLSLYFHASLDPYNSREFIEIAADESVIDWLTGKILMRGNLDLLVHTASKYDECRVLHLPNVKLAIALHWITHGNPYDHHSVMPCAPDKVPEYSSNQTHDSYRAFRSHNLSTSVSIETRPLVGDKSVDIPSALLYSSTLRWLENQKDIFSSLIRLTRRGKLFDNTKPRKPQFGRIFKNIRVTICLHKFQICYWTSFGQQQGCKLLGGHFTHSAEHTLALVPIEDGLIHKSRQVWDMSYMNTELCDAEIWLYNSTEESPALLQLDTDDGDDSHRDKQYLLSFSRVSYNRETKEISPNASTTTINLDIPTHRLVVHDLKGAWTKSNRDVMFGLFEPYSKAQLLKRNISTEALKGFKVESQSSVSVTSPTRSRQQPSAGTSSTSPASTISKGHASAMLQKLIAEVESNPNVVYTEDVGNSVSSETHQLYGVAACETNDVMHKNWLIELVNSQVMFRGCESSGYVIVSAAKTQIWQRIHRPVWKERILVSKTTWLGSLECMQYYATVDAPTGTLNDNIMWLSVDNIEERSSFVVADLPDLVGSGQSVGGVVSSIVGGENENPSCPSAVQLQRVVSRCGCQFYYASYGENVDPNELSEVPPLPDDDDMLSLEPWDREIAVDSFTLTHHDLEISTNSQQFSMIVDLINNLLLYVEPHRREAAEKLQRMRFQLQLSSIEDQRGPISQLQDKVRSFVNNLKQLEKDSYVMRKSLAEDQSGDHQVQENLTSEIRKIENEIEQRKEQLNLNSEELDMMIKCFKEAQVTASKTKEREAAAEEAGGMFIARVARRSEVCFKHGSWRLTDADGQLGLADLVLSQFLYSKVTKDDDSVEHSFELGYIHVSNLLPNQVYKDVLQPTELQPNIPLDRHRAVRVFCRERAPVGGIPVKEHLELNVIPITIGLTYAFFMKMLKFFFPERDAETSRSDRVEEHHEKGNKKKSNMKKGESIGSNIGGTLTSNISTTSSATGASLQFQNANDIEKMRERAQKNHLFVYIKIPEVPMRISYKDNKEKSFKDLQNVNLTLPTIEYHNNTWTWLDLLMALKGDSKRYLLSQAIKQAAAIKFQIRPRSNSTTHQEATQQQQQQQQPQEEEDKARMLLGDLAVPSSSHGSNKGSSKGLSKFINRK